jgi:hypothetical protein
MAEKPSWDQANKRQKLGVVWRNRKKISQIIKDYFYLPFFLLIILYSVYWDYFCRLILLSAFTTQVRKGTQFESRVRILWNFFLSFLVGMQHTHLTLFIHNGLESQLQKGILNKFQIAESIPRLEPTSSTLSYYYLTSVPRLLVVYTISFTKKSKKNRHLQFFLS